MAGSGAPRRPGAPAGSPDHGVPLATGLPRPAVEEQTRPPNRLHALANVAASRRAARCHPRPRARARDASPRCGGPGPHAGTTHGAAGQPALRTSGGGRHSEVGAAPPGTRGHGADEMPPVCGQVLHQRGDAGTPGVACGARCGPGGRQGGGRQHPAGESTEVPVARPVHPAPPAPGSRPRRWRRGGTRSGPGGRRCGPTRAHVHPRGAGPPGPPDSPGPPGPLVGPAGNGLSGRGAPRCPGGTSEPGGDADAG